MNRIGSSTSSQTLACALSPLQSTRAKSVAVVTRPISAIELLKIKRFIEKKVIKII